LNQRLLPERLAHGVDGGDEVDDTDHQDALDGTGKGRKVESTSVVFLPSEVSAVTEPPQ
jgi:hypothetical protein